MVIWSGTRKGRNEEYEIGKLVWDFEFHLSKTKMARRPDLTLEYKAKKKIWICDMECPQQQNIEAKS